MASRSAISGLIPLAPVSKRFRVEEFAPSDGDRLETRLRDRDDLPGLVRLFVANAALFDRETWLTRVARAGDRLLHALNAVLLWLVLVDHEHRVRPPDDLCARVGGTDPLRHTLIPYTHSVEYVAK